jgi:hypothetical protein
VACRPIYSTREKRNPKKSLGFHGHKHRFVASLFGKKLPVKLLGGGCKTKLGQNFVKSAMLTLSLQSIFYPVVQIYMLVDYCIKMAYIRFKTT